MSHMVTNFMKWSKAMQFYRVPIIGAMILLQGCIIAPLVLFTMASGTLGDIQMYTVTLSTFLIVTLNLADMPTKITIPIFSATTVISLGMVFFNLIS